ncbi:MAG: replication factor C large subunit [Candidatus Caldarchaeum sp.]|nr:replication factor C large subunit [Candidatus Caldarchaeum sp.]MDW7977845.1 replication factor C large subunit [Candidatus Caldarchaeum sp.]
MSQQSTVPWTEKYRPSKVSEVVGNKDAITEFLGWVEGWLKKKPVKKAAMLYGPAGVGKTSLVHAYANENGWEVIEMNASDFRTRENIERIVGAASSQASITGARNKIILVDEVDGIDARSDSGAVAALIQIIEETRAPIVLVANDPWDPKLGPLREKALLIQFRRIPKPSITAHLRRIAQAEKLKLSEQVVKEVSENSDGDLRSAINDLQMLASAGSSGLGLAERYRKGEIFNALANVFHSKNFEEAVESFNNLEMEPADFLTWVLDNAPDQLTPQELADSMEYLSKADLFLQRINVKQKWSLLRYVIPFMTAGVALSRRKPPAKYVKFSFPSRIRYFGRVRAEREKLDRICAKIGAALHMSRRKARTEMLPYLKILISSDGEELVKFFNLTDDEAEYLRGGEVVSRRKRPRS